ncbi:peptidyl-Lys metalloendopeptidase [Epithele typhae]|uniref:peptidyl-Lys metalloendopeptidase n=1 Tax=Epithele typhae TaxID=378194 RepID=UPI0020073BDA|nr:peptidyl-Lys metalloendopeptidase [Epithele typhae]KAH9944017.1 peptidyl-Lys metalloendopeptidase [Epithele typhae]
MFSSALRATLIALAASAVSVSAAPGLSLKVSGGDAFTGVENMKVATTITNTGDETLKLINDVRGALHTLPTNAFAVSSESGETPAFVGVKAKYSLDTVAASASDEDFTVLAPGASFTLTHDLSKAYNFTTSGEGKYTIEASNLFHYVDAEGKVQELRADAEAHVAALSGKLAVSRPLERRASYNGCSSSRQSSLVTAASSAQSYAASALSYLNSHTSSTTRYTTWFGTYTSSRHSTVQSHFSKISGGSYSSFTYDCTCTDSGTYAYVYPSDYGHIYLCGAFWSAPNTGTDSRAGTLIHEASHFTANGGTDDYVYGQSSAKSLASSNPDHAVFNADNHEYFAENNPSQS